MRLKPGPYLIEWRHHGVGLSENNTYYSQRVTRTATGNATEIDVLRADLPGEASCLVPRVLYKEASGVFRLKRFGETPSRASADDRGVRLAAVIRGTLSPGRDRWRSDGGTNGNINPFPVPGGYWITWTGMQVLKHDGSPHHGAGIAPSACVQSAGGVANGRVEVLEGALSLLR